MAKADVSNRVRELRQAADEMTQQELADRCGCTRQTIIALEQERYVPSLSLALRIARTFGRNVEEVFVLEE
jgi:putative transcriptional regulator